MKPEIIDKLQNTLVRGAKFESDVTYLLVCIRKIIEQDELYDTFKYLYFHCNWALHPALDRGLARDILDLFNQAHFHFKDGISRQSLPDPLRTELDKVDGMSQFEKEIKDFLQRICNIDTSWMNGDGWVKFLHLYSKIISDCPLFIKATDETSSIVSITIKSETAHILTHGQRCYKIRWILEDRSGLTGEIFVINCYDETSP